MKNILVGQSGGPTAVINGSLYGVIKEGILFKNEQVDKIYGMINGIEGFMAGRYIDLEEEFNSESIEYLRTTPAAYLGSCRYKLPQSLEDPVYEALFDRFKELNIGYFFYIGGNDSMDTVSKISRYAALIGSDIRVIGIPKTIDNDLVLTDHTPGFGSAARHVASTVREIAVDASIYNTKSVTIVEIMGRNAGWLTAASALARNHAGDNPVLIYLPEVDFDEKQFINQVSEALKHRNNLVVCVSEGIHDYKGMFICEYGNHMTTDNFGHKMLAGCGKYLENLVKSRLDVKVRSVELNVTQRCSSAQLSAVDLDEAVEAGRFAVVNALGGHTGMMTAFERTSQQPYQMRCVLKDVNEICNLEKTVPLDWISKNKCDITEDFISYAAPLICGNVQVPTRDGLPIFVCRQQSEF